MLKKYIPDTITLMNLLCGSIACIMALEGRYYPAFLFIIAAAVFDFFDGFAARALNSYSDLGKELDSLCDLVSFGLAPALMLFGWYRYSIVAHPALAWTALLLPLASALRLARFNTDPGQGDNFFGLAVPGAAMISAPLVGFVHISSIDGNVTSISAAMSGLLCSSWFIPLLSAVLSILMVSRIPMFSLKHKKLSFRKFPLVTLFIYIFLLILVLLQAYAISAGVENGFLHFTLPLGICTGISLYVVLNVIGAIFRRKTE